MSDDYRERIRIARERLGYRGPAGDEYELKVLRERVRELEALLAGKGGSDA